MSEDHRKVGRPNAGTVRARCTVKRCTYAKLNRLAKAWGFVKRNGAAPYLGSVVDKLAEMIEDPEYIKLAKAAKLVTD